MTIFKYLTVTLIFLLTFLIYVSSSVQAAWNAPTCGGSSFNGCSQTNQANCTDFGGPQWPNWTPALWQQCSNDCALPNPNNSCIPWVPPTCTGQTFSGCNLQGQPSCTDFGWPAYSGWSPALQAQCNTACNSGNPNSFCAAPPSIPSCNASNTNPSVGQNIQLNSAGAVGGIGPYSYSWTDGNGNNQNGQNISTNYSSAGTYTARVTAQDSRGTTSPACQVNINVGVPAPNCNITPTCSGSCTAPSNTCQTNNGSKSGCVYTAYSGGGSCNQTPALDQPCTKDTCSSGTCVAGTCPGPAIPAGQCFSTTPRLQGLLSTPNLTANSKFGNLNSQCVIDPVQSGIVSFKIPTYDQLKNTYFERKVSITTGPNKVTKETKTGNQTNLDLKAGGGHPDKIWNITGKLSLANPTDIILDNNQRGIIFIEGDMEIGDLNTSGNDTRSALDFTLGNDNGVVYIVKGNVLFGRNVRRFDGVIIAQGTICTAVDGTPCPSNQKDVHSNSDPGGETKQLTINGNLVSLDPAKPIQFQRNLLLSTCGGACPSGNDTTPAELINVQPKYLVIMKDLLSDTFTIQTEDTHYALNQ